VKLEQLFDGIPVIKKFNWAPGKSFGKITSDSRAVEKGDLFVACHGSRMDGHDFLTQAIYANASVLVFENAPTFVIPPAVTGIQVPNSQACLSELLKRFHGNPDRAVKMIGVTGTNGKTTIAYLLHKLIGKNMSTAYVGTLWYELPTQKIPAVNTTPGAEVLIPLLSDMRKSGVEYCVMEVSSHALDQRRIHGLEFELALFTQLTQDHLDYHKNLENYFLAKRQLFSGSTKPRHSLINKDCPYGRRLLAEFPEAKSYSLLSDADYAAKDIEISFQGTRFTLCYRGRELPFQIRLPMRHNIANVLCVLGGLDLLGFDLEDFRDVLREIPGIPGRLERVGQSGDIDVFVDYAHTPDAFERVLSESRQLAPRRIITVFGCGGDRDREKRPLMTQSAVRYSDVVILTSDNPRSEDPSTILKDMKKGLKSGSPCILHEDPDRETAIHKAIALAEAGDIVMILGKGHEDYQILGDRKIPFDDRVVAREALKRKTRVFSS